VLLYGRLLLVDVRYKVSFVALDGTDEAEMICFGDVARRIIGKPVQQLLRSSLSPNTYPQEIARIASLRFTFAVALTQQSYYRQQKTYQVVSMITAYGRHQAPGDAAQNENGGHPDNSGGDQSSSQATSHGIEEVSDATLSSPVLTSVSFVFPFPVFDPGKHQQHAVLTCSNLIYIADPSSSCSDQRSPIREKSGMVIHQLKLVIYLSCSCCTKPIQCQQSLQSHFSTIELVTWLPHS
jgi:hypothetical protein